MSESDNTALVAEVKEKLAGLDQKFSDTELETRIKKAVDGLMVDDAFVRHHVQQRP